MSSASERKQARAELAVRLVDAGLLHPRAKLAAIGSVYLFVGIATAAYPADYLLLSPLWAALAISGGLAALAALAFPRPVTVTIAGAATIVAAAARALAVLTTLATDGPDAHRVRASFAVAGAVWALVALLLWQAFVLVVIPWQRARRR